ncbi:MAG TPA: A/G-specific adenine glycosylase [Rhodocyclaceae bacterium]|nr:A/G-specific adenine glycosylase [Rhodocyclaceae bacterium]
MPRTESPNFAARLIAWQRKHGRHDLPWQNTRDPYRVWLSEIMLQQTQVATVIPYYHRFLQRFPTLVDLAAAPIEDVMPYWAGLGYYARARNLHACACAVVREHGGEFPKHPEVIASLPGIGRSTANAIAAFCFSAKVPILDGNVKRVLARCFGIDGFPGSPAVERQMWTLAEFLLPAKDVGTYIQSQMDMGATVCTRGKPRCGVCPLAEICVARRDDRQSELPAARPKRAVPQRSTRFLVLVDKAGRVLLEQRPPSGIWGGLLSLPELGDGEEADAKALAAYGCMASDWEQLPALSHTFTHFKLELVPLLARVKNNAKRVADGAGQQWLPIDDLESAALPAPIRRLLLEAASRV